MPCLGTNCNHDKYLLTVLLIICMRHQLHKPCKNVSLEKALITANQADLNIIHIDFAIGN